MATATKQRDLVSEYFNEPIFYGGLICTRIEAIRYMEEIELPERCIDRYMMGATLAADLGADEPALVFDDGDDYPGEIWGPIGVTPAAKGEGKPEGIAHYFEGATV